MRWQHLLLRFRHNRTILSKSTLRITERTILAILCPLIEVIKTKRKKYLYQSIKAFKFRIVIEKY